MNNWKAQAKRTYQRLNDAWEAGFNELLERFLRGYERLTGRRRVPVPAPRRDQRQASDQFRAT